MACPDPAFEQDIPISINPEFAITFEAWLQQNVSVIQRRRRNYRRQRGPDAQRALF